MPFNGSGQFLRLFNWQNDASNNIDINAARMDGEMDGFAAGLSNCLTRDGQGVPSAEIKWGGQNLTGVGTLSVQYLQLSGGFTSDLQVGYTVIKTAGDIRISRGGTTAGALYLVADESRYLWYDGTNYVMSGAGLNVGGNITANGNTVWHAGNFNPASYAALTGASFSGDVSRQGGPNLTVFNGLPGVGFANGAIVTFDASVQKFYFYVGGNQVASIDSGGTIRAKGDFLGGQSVV